MKIVIVEEEVAHLNLQDRCPSVAAECGSSHVSLV